MALPRCTVYSLCLRSHSLELATYKSLNYTLKSLNYTCSERLSLKIPEVLNKKLPKCILFLMLGQCSDLDLTKLGIFHS